MKTAFQRRSSTAVVVTGSCTERNMDLITKVLDQSATTAAGGKIDYSVARVKGLTYGDDRDALLRLAHDLGFISAGRNFDVNIEALQDFLMVGI